jgi:hypothetical protein
VIGAPSKPGLLDLPFASEVDAAFYHFGETIKSRVRKLYGPQTHMCALAMPMARYRPWVIDYFEQFPALPLWLAQGVTDPHHVGAKHNELIARLVVDVFDARPRLKDIMRRWSIPQPLRKIEGRALLPRHAAAARWLATMNPSLVSQVVPTRHKDQRRWLNLIAWLVEQPGITDGMRNWLLAHSRAISTAEAHDMVDFQLRAGAFDFRWTWAQASAARDRWHAETAQRDARVRYGIDPNEPICGNPLDDEVRIDGYTFHALRTPAAIMEEGGAMHHCVGSYVGDVQKRRCSIVSMRECGKRVATLEMMPRGQCRQLRGPCNSTTFMKGVRKAVEDYERLYRAAGIGRG